MSVHRIANPAKQPNRGATHRAKGAAQSACVCLAAALVLGISGILYRECTSRMQLAFEAPIELPIPLAKIPEVINNWSGRDIPISLSTLKATGNDDFLNRKYTNENTRQWANVYIGYTARPRTMVGHRPQVCYPASGSLQISTITTKIVSSSGTPIPCLIHRFRSPDAIAGEQIVLNFYIVNGQLTNDEDVFTGFGWRTPNIAGDLAHYVAQIQVSSVFESSARAAAKDLTDSILDFFPDRNGIVRAVQNIDIPNVGEKPTDGQQPDRNP